MKIISHKQAFSLTELLIAISVLAIIAALILPRFINFQAESEDSVAAAIVSHLNSVYGEWKASGGEIGNNIYTSDILRLMTDSTGSAIKINDGDAAYQVDDSGQSQSYRVSALTPVGGNSSAPVNLSGEQTAVKVGNMLLAFDNTKQMFVMEMTDNSGKPVDSSNNSAYTENVTNLTGIFFNGSLTTASFVGTAMDQNNNPLGTQFYSTNQNNLPANDVSQLTAALNAGYTTPTGGITPVYSYSNGQFTIGYPSVAVSNMGGGTYSVSVFNTSYTH